MRVLGTVDRGIAESEGRYEGKWPESAGPRTFGKIGSSMVAVLSEGLKRARVRLGSVGGQRVGLSGTRSVIFSCRRFNQRTMRTS